MMEVGVNSDLHPIMIFVDIMASDVIFLLIKFFYLFIYLFFLLSRIKIT